MGVTRSLFAVSAAAALAALLAADVRLSGDAAAQPNAPAPAAGARAGIAAQGVIEHVVVIVQENRTFDNLFGGYVNASPLGPQPYPHANSTYPPEIVKHLRATNIDDGSGDNTHDSYACLNQSLPGEGRFSSQRWISVSKHAIGPAPCSDPDKDYSYFRYVPQVQRQVYWEIARKYGLGDRFFAATSSASFPPHQFIVAGDVYFSAPTTSSVRHVSDQPSNFPHGCFDHPSYSTVPVVGPNVFSEYLPIQGALGGCYPRTTYGDRLNAKNVSWVHYTTNLPTPAPTPTPLLARSANATPTLPPIHAFNGFTNVQAWYKQTAPLPTEHFRATTQILKDTPAASPLPAFLWVKPPCIKQSDHPGAGGHNGQNWVGSVINAIGNSPNWKSTVIFVIWDDWGGFYDHVVPPPPDPHQRRLGRGVRIPFLVISPYLARPGGVVGTEGHPGSIMRFADDLYGLQPLTEFDAQAPDLAGWFDFTKPPRPFVPIVGATGAGAWNDSLCRNSSMTMDD